MWKLKRADKGTYRGGSGSRKGCGSGNLNGRMLPLQRTFVACVQKIKRRGGRIRARTEAGVAAVRVAEAGI
ncbi:MAG: hypothetical protein RSA41_07695 [Christensenella sp.]